MLELPEQQDLILIIDDSVNTIRLISGMLKDLGSILFATTGEEGIRLARQRRPHLILLDVEMPGMDGHEVCRRLKADPDTCDCAIVFVTGSAAMETEIAALDAGAVDFITKPLNPPVVRARVRNHLSLQRHAMLLAQLANRDGLTRLFNRRYFDEQLEREFERHKRQKLPLGLAMIDIDYFKAYNDGYGHQQGDRCLVRVAEAIGAATRRPGEIVARYGGEEFVVILPYTSEENAQKYGEWICEHVRGLCIEHCYSAAAGVVTISVGAISAVPGAKSAACQLIAGADRALYEAKDEGRNRCRYGDSFTDTGSGVPDA